MLNKFIAIEGNIGVGKTTLAEKLAKDYNARLILEEFSNNPFLAQFYNDPEKKAFPLELFFMAERYYQLKRERENDLFQPFVISDYFFMKSKLFAQNNLKKDELQLFNRLFDIMSLSVVEPELVIYLYSNIERLQQNIRERGRKYEQNISNSYLQEIQDIYLDYLRKQSLFPVLLLDVSDIDFKNNELEYEKIKSLINQKYSARIHHIDISE